MTTNPGTSQPGDHPQATLTGSPTGPADDLLSAVADVPETPAHSGDDADTGRAVNADQERLARRFIAVAHEQLAGRDPGSRRLLGCQPRERVVLGVVAPQDPPVEPPVTVQDLPAEPGVPVDQLPASEFGLACLIEPDHDILTVEATVRFALYLQHYPTYDEQFQHAALAAGHDDPAAESTDAAPAVHGAAGHGKDDGEDKSPAPAPGTTSAAGPTDSAAPEDMVRKPAPSRGKRESSDPPRLVYQRYDVTANVRLTIPVPGSSIPVTADDDGALRSAAAHAVQSQAAAPGGPATGTSPAGGPYRLLTSAGQRIPREAMTGPDTFDRWLAANAAPGWAAPTAEPHFTATVHRAPSGRIRLALTLANAAVRAPRDHGFLAEVSLYDAGFEATVSGGVLVNMGYRTIDSDYRITPEVYAHGRFCCLDEEASDPASGKLVTTAFPVFRQAVYESRPDLEPAFIDLARDPVPILRRIAGHMEDFLGQWDAYLDSGPPLSGGALEQCRADRDTFADEHARFVRGIDLIDADLSSQDPGGLGVAFCWMNEAMRRLDAPGGVYTRPGRRQYVSGACSRSSSSSCT